MKAIDLVGKTFGRWTVISRDANTPNGQATWLCRCECGTTRALKSIVLRNGNSQSCGCRKRELTVARSTKHGHANAGKISPTYHSWSGMITRCTNAKDKRFAGYGGRGIKVCERWMTFENFLADMGEKPDGKSLDRIDTNGEYSPENCRWATSTQQARNKRNNRVLTHDGISKTLTEWADEIGITQSSIAERLERGWPVERALTEEVSPRGKQHLITFEGRTQSVTAWAREFGIHPGTLSHRIRKGWPIDQALAATAKQS